VKVLPATPTNSAFPSGIRVSRRPPPSALGSLPGFAEANKAFGGGGVGPGSPGLPVFARRKRSVFKGPMQTSSCSPSGFGRTPMATGSRSASVQGRRSGEIVGGIAEEEEDEEEGILSHTVVNEEDEDDGDEEKWEDADQFGPELPSPTPGVTTDEAVSPLLPVPDLDLPPADKEGAITALDARNLSSASIPLTQEALAKKDKQDEELNACGEHHNEVAAVKT